MLPTQRYGSTQRQQKTEITAMVEKKFGRKQKQERKRKKTIYLKAMSQTQRYGSTQRQQKYCLERGIVSKQKKSEQGTENYAKLLRNNKKAPGKIAKATVTQCQGNRKQRQRKKNYAKVGKQNEGNKNSNAPTATVMPGQQKAKIILGNVELATDEVENCD
jgi:lipopolysaccharide export LptBFGC system permease protein LptF